MKGVACGKFIRRAPNWQKTCDHEKRIFWPVFGQNKIFQTQLFHFCSSLFCLFLGYWYFLEFFDFFLLFLWYFSSLRSTKEVTTENMSLNKWKAWLVENSKDVLKIDIKLVTTKRGSCDQFLAKIKFFEPGCFTFAPLFFIYFWSINIFFGILWLFPFISLIFFLHLGAQKK